jgi:hypothetical protein
MTVSSTVEMKLRGRKPSDAPARAAAKVLGVEPVTAGRRVAREEQRILQRYKDHVLAWPGTVMPHHANAGCGATAVGATLAL